MAYLLDSNIFIESRKNLPMDVWTTFAYIIATARAKQMTLVTFEKSNPQRKSRVMIPDACAAIGVTCCDLNTMLRSMGITI